ncbi:MAG: TatD family hydrolase [Prevotella sp.]|nr:TatD family hydrolase [Prevotella sp.]
MIDTHAHLDGEEFNDDREAVMQRAREAGITKILVPAIDLTTSRHILTLCRQHQGFLYPMVGLHPEEVHNDWEEQLGAIRQLLPQVPLPSTGTSPSAGNDCPSSASPQQPAIIAIGEVGLDYYWSREFEHEQLMAFEEQVKWSVESRLPLMIHCRKAQNEMVSLLKHYKDELPGGVFHCFTGNEHEAEELLQFPQFVLGIGGVLTFKKSHLPEVLPQVVPLERIVLETDAPYMAPVPMRGKRNESAYVRHVLQRLAEAYDVSEDHLEQVTDQNVRRIFKI